MGTAWNNPAVDKHLVWGWVGGGGVAILSIASCYRNQEELQSCKEQLTILFGSKTV